jgi:molybdopterin synthase catalytic subunit
MIVRVRLFAMLRERAGTDAVELDLPSGASAADVLAELGELTREVPVVLAVNQEYATPETPLAPGDELALIPPVSGGAPPHVRVTDAELSLDELAARVGDPRAGAVVTFSGVTRDVPELEYEAYVPMAEQRIARIVSEAIETHRLCAAAAEHRVGTVPRSEASVIVAASAPHRAEAFAGAREIIDRIKAEAPIWKQEGAEWVTGTRPPMP